MIDKRESRLRRAAQKRLRQRSLGVTRHAGHRTNQHIYAQVISGHGAKERAAASTAEKEVRAQLANGGNKAAAAAVGKRIAEKATKLGIERVAFDRGGFRFHGRVKALAEAARESGLKF
jgi:large subunit ribosomal protein L18